jgi:hypothetical protein
VSPSAIRCVGIDWPSEPGPNGSPGGDASAIERRSAAGKEGESAGTASSLRAGVDEPSEFMAAGESAATRDAPMSRAAGEPAAVSFSAGAGFAAIDDDDADCAECADSARLERSTAPFGVVSPCFRNGHANPTPSTSTTAAKHNFLRRLTVASAHDATDNSSGRSKDTAPFSFFGAIELSFTVNPAAAAQIATAALANPPFAE